MSDSLLCSCRIPVVRFDYGQVMRREGRIGLGVGLVSATKAYFSHVSGQNSLKHKHHAFIYIIGQTKHT